MELREYIRQRGIPIAEFGRRVGVPLRATMHKYVVGKSIPPRSVQERIAHETGGLVLPADFVAIANDAALSGDKPRRAG